MYSRVPPPVLDEGGSNSTDQVTQDGRVDENESDDDSKPSNIAKEQWKRFQQLRVRREKECGKGSVQRMNAMRNTTLKVVSQELSEVDKAILEMEGTSLPTTSHRKTNRKRKRNDAASITSSIIPESSTASDEQSPSANEKRSEKDWQDVRKYLDPNPQLRGWDKGKYADKNALEVELDAAIEEGQLEDAVAMSDKLANRDFAKHVAKAFDCQDYVRRRKQAEERKKARKSKIKLGFEPKKRWECKGNM